jgi:hypothetical protein
MLPLIDGETRVRLLLIKIGSHDYLRTGNSRPSSRPATGLKLHSKSVPQQKLVKPYNIFESLNYYCCCCRSTPDDGRVDTHTHIQSRALHVTR